jgi:hypothetical protein
MEEITLDGVVWLSTRRAAELTGYTSDYVGQLARGGKVLARLVGRNWYVGRDAILAQKFGPYAAAVATSEPPRPASGAEEALPPAPSQEVATSVVVAAPMPAKSHEETLKEIQDAWETWFTVRPSAPPVSVRAAEVGGEDRRTEESQAPAREAVSAPLAPGEERVSINLLRSENDAAEEQLVGQAMQHESDQERTNEREPLFPLALAGAGRGLLVGVSVALLIIAVTYVSSNAPITAGVEGAASVMNAVRDFLAQTRYVD